MTLEEILNIENLQLPVIFLHRTGISWRVYEYSAYRFIHDIPLIEYRLYKWVDDQQQEERICLSFPAPHLSLFIEQYPHAHIASDLIALPSDYPVSPLHLLRWKETVPLGKVRE